MVWQEISRGMYKHLMLNNNISAASEILRIIFFYSNSRTNLLLVASYPWQAAKQKAIKINFYQAANKQADFFLPFLILTLLGEEMKKEEEKLRKENFLLKSFE
jgi:hypothetical protein